MAEFCLQAIAQFLNNNWGTLLTGFLVLYFLWFYVLPLTTFKRLGIPGPFPVPLVGTSIQALKGGMNKVPRVYLDWSKIYGKVYGVFLFSEPAMVVTDPEIVKQILVKEFQKFHDRKPLFDVGEPFDKTLLFSRGEKWKTSRGTLSPSFTSSKMKQMLPFMDEAVNTLLTKMESASKSGEIVDVLGWLQKLTMDVILSTAFGVKSEVQTSGENNPILQTAKKVQGSNLLIMLMMMLPFGVKLIKFLPDPYGFDEMASYANAIIKERTKTNDYHRKDLLQLMLDSNETEEKKMSSSEITGHSVVFLLAGYETSSTTLAFLFHRLAVDTHIQDKLRDEIDRTWTGDEDTPPYELLPQMEYLDMVLNETLRMYPPGYIIVRECTEACTINGVFFPKDMSVLIPVYALHHDPEHWNEPDKFEPMRFSEEEKKNRSPYVFLPFGHGPRSCIGTRFVALEVKLALVKILKKFKLERTEQTAVPLEFSLQSNIVCPPGKVMLRFVPRD